MDSAHHEKLEDDGTYYGEISACPGVYANAPTLQECRKELEEVLDQWLLLRVHRNLSIPEIRGTSIKIAQNAAA